MQKLLLVYYHSENRARCQMWKILPNMVFSPIWGEKSGKNGDVLSMRMQVILDSSFARPGSAPIGDGKKGEFRDWTRRSRVRIPLKQQIGKFTAMIILHFDLQPQFKYMSYFVYISHHKGLYCNLPPPHSVTSVSVRISQSELFPAVMSTLQNFCVHHR